MIVCVRGRGSGTPVCCSFCPYTKHLWGASFLVTPSCGATALSSKTGTYVPARRSKSARTRKKRGWGGCVCVWEEDKNFSYFNPRWFPLLKKKKNHNFTSILFFLPVFPRGSYLFFPSFPPLQAHFFSFWHREKRKKRKYIGGNEGEKHKHNLKKRLLSSSLPKSRKRF